MTYASNTSVSVAKTRGEIEDAVIRYGATGFASGFQDNRAVIAFVKNNQQVKFVLPLPDRNAQEITHRLNKRINWRKDWIKRNQEDAHKVYEQACRTRWRALFLCIKAKLEAVESGITTFEEEFLPHFVTPDGSTIGEKLIPQLPAIRAGSDVKLLGM